MSSSATPDEYIASKVPAERLEAFNTIRKTILENLQPDFEEGMNYGMLGYYIPHTVYPNGYHCDPKLPLPFANLANRKGYIALYHMGIYANPDLHKWFTDEYSARCKYKLDMGKSCIRFKKTDDIPYDLIGELFQKMSAEDWIKLYEKEIKG